jgi:hypothetical protein
MPTVQLLPLTSGAELPRASPAGTRPAVPPGYGVQEQCLPFTAANALGFLVGAPFRFGLCPPAEVPAGGHPFRSPVPSADADARVFYVVDDPGCRFAGNAFHLDGAAFPGGTHNRHTPVQPGLSFFDRPDQGDLVKVHLPYILRTTEEVDALFLPPLNRGGGGFAALSGLVESDWYANPVNLVLRCPPAGQAAHVARGEPLAQLLFLPRAFRRPELEVLPWHSRAARNLSLGWLDWHRRHAEDRSAYKKLARSREGRLA